MWAGFLSILKLVPMVEKLIDGITGWLHDRKVANDQKTADQRDQAVAGLTEIDKAQQGRDAAAGDIAADPSSVRKPGADIAPRSSDGIS